MNIIQLSKIMIEKFRSVPVIFHFQDWFVCRVVKNFGSSLYCFVHSHNIKKTQKKEEGVRLGGWNVKELKAQGSKLNVEK